MDDSTYQKCRITFLHSFIISSNDFLILTNSVSVRVCIYNIMAMSYLVFTKESEQRTFGIEVRLYGIIPLKGKLKRFKITYLG